MIYLLDTKVLIYRIKHHPPSVAEGIGMLRRLDALARKVTVAHLAGPGICQNCARACRA